MSSANRPEEHDEDDEIEQVAQRLSTLLRKRDVTTVDNLLARIRKDALPEPSPDQVTAQQRVLDAQAAQRAVALYRTKAMLHDHAAQRSAKVVKRLSRARLSQDENFRATILQPAIDEQEKHEKGAAEAFSLAEQKEHDFVTLRKDAHIAVAHIRAKTLVRFNHEFERAISYQKQRNDDDVVVLTTGLQAANRIYEVCRDSNEAHKHVRVEQPIPAEFQGRETTPDYLDWLRKQSGLMLGPSARFNALLDHLASTYNGKSSVAPLKGYARVVEKVQEKYSGNYARILDLIRGMVVFDNIVDLSLALDGLSKLDSVRIIRAKDRLSPHFDASGESGGYRDVLLNLQFTSDSSNSTENEDDDDDGTNHQNGLIAELQLHSAPFLAIKNDQGHVDYEMARSIHMLDEVFSHRSFVWALDSSESAVEGLLKDVREGALSSLSLDYSEALWSEHNQARLAAAVMDERCRVTSLSLKSCKCGDSFIKLCIPDGFIDDNEDQQYKNGNRIHLGSLIHEGTAGRISADGVTRILSVFNNSARHLDLEGCLDLNGEEYVCGDEIAEAVGLHVRHMEKQGINPLPQLHVLNLRQTGLTTKGYSLLKSLQEEGYLPLMEVLHTDLEGKERYKRVVPLK